jgi:hypothetical protein
VFTARYGLGIYLKQINFPPLNRLTSVQFYFKLNNIMKFASVNRILPPSLSFCH